LWLGHRTSILIGCVSMALPFPIVVIAHGPVSRIVMIVPFGGALGGMRDKYAARLVSSNAIERV